MIPGVDVHSEYQAGFDFDRAYDVGHAFAWLKATQGSRFVPMGTAAFANAAESAAKSRAVVGYYHFLDSTANGATQAQHYLRTLDRFGDGHKGNMIAVDYELNGQRTAGDRHLRGFIAEMRRHIPARKPIVVYSGWAFWTGNAPNTTRSGPLAAFGENLIPWDARYPDMDVHERPVAFFDDVIDWYETTPMWGAIDRDHVKRRFWQYTSKGRVADMHVDVNAFFGTYEQLQTIAGLMSTELPAPPIDEDKPVREPSDPVEADAEAAIAYALKMLGTPYGTGWRAGTWPALSPLYSRITKHDPPSWYRQRFCICSGLGNVLRFEIVDLPAFGRRQGDSFAGGMAAIGRHFSHAEGSAPYPPVKNTPRGWAITSPYLGTALALQGHFSISLGNGKVVESRVPSLSANRTENEGSVALIRGGGRPYTRIIPPRVWLRK